MDFKEIQELIRLISKSNIGEVRIEQDNFKITLRSRDYVSPTQRSNGDMMPMPFPMPMFPQQQQGGGMQQNFQQQPQQQLPQQSLQPAAPTEAPAAPVASDKFITVKSPMVGTFYRSAGPDKENFVKVGDVIKPGQVLCIIEAMKLFNEIESEVSGKVVKILVDNAKPVEYDQPLFLVEPA
ncbi:MAG TPA: acetyl-CoA carboxylase biotin carboxyl carrier protein [Chitinophagales bacterium]|nr:acetyl-CoA carboxylase biotin carboxyl carrier protein [Chitinophagales bacterium]